MTTYFGFAISDSMFAGNCSIERRQLNIDEVKSRIQQGVEPCLNSSHQATIQAMQEKFGIDVPIPVSPPRVQLDAGDSLVVLGVRGLPRLTDRHEYTAEEVASATFSFAEYKIVG